MFEQRFGIGFSISNIAYPLQILRSKLVLFKVRPLETVNPAVRNSLDGQASVAGLRNRRIPNTFISASTEKGNNRHIPSSQTTFAKQHIEGHGNVALIYASKL